MPRRWVVNASPLIILAKIKQVHLLYELCEEMVIPAGVAEEIKRSPDENDPARIWMRSNGKDFVRETGRIPPIISAWDLGLGESEVLSWANEHHGWEGILDDKAARNCAASLGVRVRGTLGIILLAKKEGKISNATFLLDLLRQAGFRIDPPLMQEAKRLAGEA
jgi:predicted nucleic acid-binding protein